MNIGDIVVVVNTQSLPENYLGRYGVIEDVGEYKVWVEFNRRVNNVGSLTHIAYTSDLLKIGETHY